MRTRCPKNCQLNLNGKSHALGDIGRTLELSLERVQKIESKGLQKLRS
ncbi:MAG: sigma factor-like helix-turn-helix DNA-binding protein [Microcystis sp. LE19-338.1B]|nr:sigma factor-like helix-turn-helix DNA-binding protein [Microcystis sp. LE19-338.1B]MCZ8357957.1 sigma factor-like helix-turn-helix DNA-binding protein [Microcystis sp. LE19-388.1G]